MYNKYDNNIALFYDFDNRQHLKDDIDFVLKHVSETTGNILEMACGTGRLTIPIVKNVLNTDRMITAIDLSSDMLNVLTNKLQEEKILNNNIQIINEDMTKFRSKSKYGLIIMMWRAFQFIIDLTDANNFLLNLYKLMDSDGILLLNVSLPHESYGAEWINKEIITYDVVDEKTGTQIIRATKNVSANEQEQYICYMSKYKIIFKNGKTEHHEHMIKLRYYYPNQIKEMIHKHNLLIVEELHTLNENSTTTNDIYYVIKKDKGK